MAKCLVTGGAGFIGSNITERLVQKGEEVRVLDNLSTGSKDNLAGCIDKLEFIEGDIRDDAALDVALEGVDRVFHQAALRSVARSVEIPEETNDVNVRGTLRLLLRSAEKKVRRFVYASSSSVYGSCAAFPQKESHPPEPISPYAVSKLAGEYYCRMFARTFSLETVSLRYFNVFGPRQNPESKYSAVIPAFLDRIMRDLPCVIEGDGTQSRDFTYVGNVVDANLAASEAQGVSGGFFNVACGEEHSVLDIAERIKKIVGKGIDNQHAPRRAGDVDRTYADITGLKEALGLKDLVGFDEGLERTVKWFTSRR